MENLNQIWEGVQNVLAFNIIEAGGHSISVFDIITIIVILIGIKILVKGLERLIKRKFQGNSSVKSGKQHAITQIGKYLLYVIGFVFALEAIGINTTTLIISSSALFVGLGFGLQEAFRDFISGLILLFEGDVIIGDVVEMDNGTVAVVKHINLRTSKVRTRDGIIMIVPNSQLINDRVINWSNSNKITRFHVNVGVAYGSDTKLVEEILLDSAKRIDQISTRMKPVVRFVNFGDSSLDFELHFWSEEVWKVEDIKSNLRFDIDQEFRKNKVSIPFPQRDLHLKSSTVPFDKSSS